MALMSALLVSSCGLRNPTDLDVRAPKTTLRVGETVRLSVTQKMPGGSTRDLMSRTTGTVYYTTGESMLIPEPDGKVTCIKSQLSSEPGMASAMEVSDFATGCDQATLTAETPGTVLTCRATQPRGPHHDGVGDGEDRHDAADRRLPRHAR